MASSLEACDQPANCAIQSVISAGGLSLSGINLLLVEQEDVDDVVEVVDDDEVDGIWRAFNSLNSDLDLRFQSKAFTSAVCCGV